MRSIVPVLVTAVTIIGSTFAAGEEATETWVRLPSFERSVMYYYDAASVERHEDGMVAFTTSYEFPEGHLIYARHVARIEFDCRSKRIRYLWQSFTKRDGSRQRTDEPGAWMSIAPTTVHQKMYNAMCE